MGVIMHNNIPYGGGSAVEANVAGATPSENLSTLTIDGVTYDTTELVFCYDDNGSLYTDSTKATAVSGDDSKLYIATNTGKQYRYNGSAFSALGVNAINDLSDVTITSASDGQALEYDATAGKWKNVAKKAADTPTFSEASTRANISGSGETMATILGKIKKWFSDLKTVAFTGAYSDLSGTPTIPTVNNGTLTIQKNGTNVQTFSANQSGNATANIECATPSDVEGSKVATGNPLTVTDAAGIKAEKIEIGFEPKQAGSGTPSPSNIRPITGYTSLSADGCGKNLWDGTDSYTNGFLQEDGSIAEPFAHWRVTKYIKVIGGNNYTLSFSGSLTLNNSYICFYDENYNFISSFNWTTSKARTVLAPNNAKYVRASYYDTITDLQVEEGTIATPYKPYNGSNVTIQLGQTLYGGKLTILQDGSAEVDVDTAYYKFVGNETWSIASSGNCRCERFTDMVQDSNGVCSHLPTGGANGDAYFGDGVFIIVNGRDTYNLNSTNAVQAFTTNMETAYKLAIPFTIHLSPVETLNLLQGINNVWTDGTTLSLTYQPDNAIGQAKGTAQELVDSASTWKLFAESANANIALPTNCKELYICVIYVTGSTSAIMYDFHILPDILTKATSYFRQGDYYTPDYFSRCEIRIRKTSNVYDTRVEHLYMNNTTDRAENTTVKVYYR